MTLPEIDPNPAGDWPTYFARRGPWGALFARSGNNNKTTQGTDGDDGERASGERTVVEMATALKGGCRGVGNRGPRI